MTAPDRTSPTAPAPFTVPVVTGARNEDLAYRLGAAVVGLGVGEEHARVLSLDRWARLKLVLDKDTDRARSVAHRFGVNAAAGMGEILQDPDIALVVVASYDHDHFAETVAALQARKHVFVEKPLCQTIAELREIKAAWLHSDGLHLASNLVLRTAPLYRWLRNHISQGCLGRIYAFDGDYLYGRIEKILEGWRRDSPGYSGLKGGGIHLIDLMLWITGERPVSVSAAGNRIATAGRFPSDDYIAAVYRFPSGMVGRITVNLGSVHRHHHVVRIFGTKGTFIYDDAGPRLHMSSDPAVGAERPQLDPLPASKGALLPGFVAAIAAGRRDESATQKEIDSMSACLAAEHALAQGSEVRVEYV